MNAPAAVAPQGATVGVYPPLAPRQLAAPATGPAPQAVPKQATPLKAADLTVLRDKIRQVLAMYYPRHQNTRDNNPWEVIHAIVAYGVDQQLFKGGPGGEKVNAIGWLAYNHPCAGYQMFTLHGDKIEGRRGVGVQGHGGQFLAYIAQSHLKSDYPMMVGGKQFTLADLIEQEKETCVAGEELTFKLIGLSHYLDSDATWTTPDGQEWSIQKLISEELKQPIRGAACGGTHRLMGFSYSINKRLQRGKPIVGEFARAQLFIRDYHRYTFSLQNADGSFSTDFFVRRAESPDLNARLNSTGHILEWISFSLADEELLDPRMIQAVDYLTDLMINNDKMTWSIGPLGHGLHGLAIYHNRVFKDAEFTPSQLLVEGQPDSPREARLRDRHPRVAGLASRLSLRPASADTPALLVGVARAVENLYHCGAVARRGGVPLCAPIAAPALDRPVRSMKTFRFTEQFETIFEAAAMLSRSADADAIMLLLDGPTDWEQLKAHAGDEKILIAADFAEQIEGAADAGLAIVVLKMPEAPVYEKLTQALLEAVADDILAAGAQVVALYSGFEAGTIDSVSLIHLGEHLGQLTARDLRQLETRVPLDTIKTVVDMAVEIGREGREGKPVGTLFVVGDSRKVLSSSHPAGFDPVKGYSRQERNLDDPRVREGIKEIAQLDGAIVVSAEGIVEASARYIDAPADNITLPKGLGARHWAAAAISRKTNAVAVAVSESNGTVRIFQNGEVTLRVEPFRRPMKWKDFEYEPPPAE